MLNHGKTCARVALAAAVCALCVAALAEDASRRTLPGAKLLPEGSIALIRARSVKELVDGVSDFADVIRKGSSEAAKGMLGMLGMEFIADPAKAGIDPNRPVIAVVLNPVENPDPFVFVLPAADQAKLMAEVTRMLGEPEGTEEDLTRFTRVTDGPGPDADVFVKADGGRLIVGGSAAAVRAVAARAGDLAALKLDSALHASLYVSRIRSIYRDDIDAAIKELREAAEKGRREPQGGGMPNNPMATFLTLRAMGVQMGPEALKLAVEILDQIEGAELELTADKDALRGALVVIAREGSTFGRIIDSQKRMEDSTAALVPAGGLFTMVARINMAEMKAPFVLACDRLHTAAVEAAEAGAAGDGEDVKALRAELVEWIKLARDAFFCEEGESAVAFVPSGGGLAQVQAVRYKGADMNVVEALMERGLLMIEKSRLLVALQGLQGGGGPGTQIKVERGTREYAGVKITRTKQEIPDAPQQIPAAIMYGSPRISEFGVVRSASAIVSAGGKESAARLDEAIDRVMKARTEGSYVESKRYLAVRKAAPTLACALWDLSPALYGKMILQTIMAAGPGGEIPAEVAKKLDDLVADEMPVWGCVESSRGAASIGFEVPAASIAKVVKVIEEATAGMGLGGDDDEDGGEGLMPPGIGGGVF